MSTTNEHWEKVFNEAWEAGVRAVKNNKHKVVPMVVVEHVDVLNDNSPVKNKWLVNDGVCGFAWVNVKPATSSFCKWLKKVGIVEDRSYYGGYDIWISDYGQSMQMKEWHAHGMAEIFRKYNIKAYALSRMD